MYNDNLSNISFIADSGATEHIISNKGLIMEEFTRSTGEFIKSANKNNTADIKIDGKGNLFLHSNLDNKTIYLTNVIAAGDISHNLLSLRRFADAGCGIYMDDQQLQIFDKISGDNYLCGLYKKPHWVINLKAIDNLEDKEYAYYSCQAKLVSLDEFLTESQMDVQYLDNDSILKESTKTGRENLEEFTFDLEKELEYNFLNRKILNLEDINSTNEINDLQKIEESELLKINSVKLNEGLLWHYRLGHPSIKYLNEYKKRNDFLQNVKFNPELINSCEVCKLAKMKRLPFENNRKRYKNPLQLINADIMGPINPLSFAGNFKYILVTVDDATRYAKTYYLKNKSEAGDKLEKFISHVRNLIGYNAKLCYVRADNAKEFEGGRFFKIIMEEKAETDFSPPYTPQLNGTAERFNKTIQNIIRAFLIDSGIPCSMWILAAEAATYMYNRTPHKSNNFETPLNKLNPDSKEHSVRIRRFGCLAYVKIPSPEGKFTNRSLICILVGFTKTGYLLWHPLHNIF